MSEFDLEERETQKVEEIAHSLKMQWDTPAFDGKTLLLVEYDTDKRCYYKLFNEDKVELRTTRGCNGMRRLFLAIQKFSIPNFAIQDSDFARVCKREPEDINYFITDCHDHEMMCFANQNVMADVFKNLAIRYDKYLIDEVFEDLRMLSYLKWYNYSQHLNIKFKGYNPRGKKKDALRSIKSIFDIVKSHSPNRKKDIIESEVLDFVSKQPKQSLYEITNGHDFLDVLSQSIGEKYGMPFLQGDHIRPIIYTCFTIDRFVDTDLYKAICKWAGKDAPLLFAA
jgi:hypothetical protein